MLVGNTALRRYRRAASHAVMAPRWAAGGAARRPRPAGPAGGNRIRGTSSRRPSPVSPPLRRRAEASRRSRPLSVIAILATLPWVASAPLRAVELDSAQIRLRAPCHTDVWWENVKQPPVWLAGVLPRYDPASQLHVACLAPGLSVTVRLPPRTMLRVVRPQGCLRQGEVELWTSNGTGLYCRQHAASSADGRSLLLTLYQPDVVLARVTRPADQGETIGVALFLSQRDVDQATAMYQSELAAAAPAVPVRRDDQRDAETYYAATPERPLSVRVAGPLRVAVETRLRYPASESQRWQTYQVRAWGNGQLNRILEYETWPEMRHQVLVGDRSELVGQVQTAYLQIPAGPWHVELDPTAPLYVRLRVPGDGDYLCPSLNAPRRDSVAWNGDSTPFETLVSGWDFTSEDARRLLLEPTRCVSSQARLAVRSARDNQFRDGGLRARCGCVTGPPNFRTNRKCCMRRRASPRTYRLSRPPAGDPRLPGRTAVCLVLPAEGARPHADGIQRRPRLAPARR